MTGNANDGEADRGRSLLLRLSEDEFERLKYVADALDLSVSQTLRSLIPNIALPQQRAVRAVAEIAAAAPFDLVPIEAQRDRDHVRRVLGEIRNANAALTLADEIDQQLLQAGSAALRVDTYKRLGRWCHPHRWTEREERIQPLAHKLSELLFGRVIDRIG